MVSYRPYIPHISAANRVVAVAKGRNSAVCRCVASDDTDCYPCKPYRTFTTQPAEMRTGPLHPLPMTANRPEDQMNLSLTCRPHRLFLPSRACRRWSFYRASSKQATGSSNNMPGLCKSQNNILTAFPGTALAATTKALDLTLTCQCQCVQRNGPTDWLAAAKNAPDGPEGGPRLALPHSVTNLSGSASSHQDDDRTLPRILKVLISPSKNCLSRSSPHQAPLISGFCAEDRDSACTRREGASGFEFIRGLITTRESLSFETSCDSGSG
jgi:hypothetical protein